ncbi:MAG: LysR family transcriptional regulator [Actinomycetota bacterium]|nr:LysR family transcriptional regulator [Actinomycetota bacterium]
MTMQLMHDVSLPAGSFATFVAIHHAGSISGAADRLHLSQPAVSRRLQALERRLGSPLFDRVTGGLTITDAGRALLPHAERALAAEADGARAVAERRDHAIGSVAIGVVGSLVDTYLAPALRALVVHHPQIELAITTTTSVRIRDLVRRGELALGISYAHPDDDDLTVRTIARERLRVVAAPEHPAAGSALRPSDLRRHRWLVFPDPAAHPETSGTIARRALERHHVPVERLHPIDSLTAQRALALAAYGLALLPEAMVADDLAGGRLVAVAAPALAADAPVTLLTRRHAHVSPAASAVIELLVRT